MLFLTLTFLLTASIFSQPTMAIQRVSSLLAAEEAFAALPTTSTKNNKYTELNLTPTSEHNTEIISVANSFLCETCPQLLSALESHPDSKSSQDRLIKIGRNIIATLNYDKANKQQKLSTKTSASLDRLVKECTSLANLLSTPVQVPKVRYGRTGIQMPIVTLGCMRFQQSWNRGGTPVTSMEQVETECQENLVNILRHAIHCGVNHIETALGYGCSEMQIGEALKVLFAEGVKRQDLIIQTKGGITSKTSKSDYKSSIVQQIDRLGVGYVDLFSVHGLNTQDHLDWLFNNGEKGDLMDALR